MERLVHSLQHARPPTWYNLDMLRYPLLSIFVVASWLWKWPLVHAIADIFLVLGAVTL